LKNRGEFYRLYFSELRDDEHLIPKSNAPFYVHVRPSLRPMRHDRRIVCRRGLFLISAASERASTRLTDLRRTRR